MTSSHLLSRRSFLTAISLTTASLALPSRRLFAQTDASGAPSPFIANYRKQAADVKVRTVPLRRNVSALFVYGGNMAVLPGKDGKVIIDSGVSTSQSQIAASLTAISADPITHLINTHWHFDHTDGNQWMHAAGATILAHKNTQSRLSTPQYMEIIDTHFAPAPAAAVPTDTFLDSKTLHLNGETLHLGHYAPAHTDTDIFIYFEHADVLHIADTWFNGFYPLIDLSSGGNINGMVAAADRSLAMASPKTIIVPGHGPIGDKAKLSEYRDMLAAIRDNVAALKKQGHTLEETIAAKPTASFDAKWGGGSMTPSAFTTLVYKSL